MSIAELFETGEQKQYKSHFRNLVMVAKADGVIETGETMLLRKIAREIGLSDANFNTILENPERFEVYPPESKQERDEQLYQMIQMVVADADVEISEVKLVAKLAVALGYPVDKSEEVAAQATTTIVAGGKLEEMSAAVDALLN